MTVYKPLQKEAQITADLVKALHDGTDTAPLTNGSSVQMSDGSTVPAAYAVPIAVDKTNIQSTVIADGYYSISQVCQGLPAGAGGICGHILVRKLCSNKAFSPVYKKLTPVILSTFLLLYTLA